MRRPVQMSGKPPGFNIGALSLALIFHMLAVSLVWSATPEPIISQPSRDISVVIVEAALPRTPEPVIIAPEPAPPPPKPESPPRPDLVPDIEPEPQPETMETPDSLPPAPPAIIQQDDIAGSGDIAFPENPLQAEPHIPSRWALKPPLAPGRLKGLGFTQDDIACLTSLKSECQGLRKEVFAEYRLTETELVWTPNRPDTGMPAEFRGLSENEILEKLGMNYAGGNALMIVPGISIDGPLWDKFHGVNKPCKLRPNYGNVMDGTAGTIAPRRVCD